jgi:hypothetical protein
MRRALSAKVSGGPLRGHTPARIDEPFEVIGQIYYDDPGSFQILSVDSAMEPLKQKARAIGANGLIMERSEPVESGIISRGIYVEALAVRLIGRNS